MFEDGAACMFLGFTSVTDSLQKEPIRSHAMHTSKNRQRTMHNESSGSFSYTAEGTQPRATYLARIRITSPWFYIVVELLAGQDLCYPFGDEWIYPFKYAITYFKHMRKFLQVLDEMELSSKIEDLYPTLASIAQKVSISLGQDRSDLIHSNDKVARIVGKQEAKLPTHFEKTKKSLPGDREKEDTERLTEYPLSFRDDSGPGQSHKDLSTTAENKPLAPTCTCLRDARDHLRLFCDVIDEHLSDLLFLESAISDHSLKRIKFQDLWFLYKPGDLIITSKAPHQAYRFVHVCGGRPWLTKSAVDWDDGNGRDKSQDKSRNSKVPHLAIDCIMFNFDGKNFGPVQKSIEIPEFSEERNIVDLDVYPIEFAENKIALRKALLTRGHRFATFRNCKHQRYAGLDADDPPQQVRRTTS